MVFDPDGEMVSARPEEFEELFLEGGDIRGDGGFQTERGEGRKVEKELRQQTAARRGVAQLQREVRRVRVVEGQRGGGGGSRQGHRGDRGGGGVEGGQVGKDRGEEGFEFWPLFGRFR